MAPKSSSGSDPDQGWRWTANVRDIGFRPASLWASLSISALVVGQLFVAIAKAHWATGLWVQAGGDEDPLLLMVIAVAVGGPGRYSADAALGWDG